jgi:hypothetical protein
LKSALLPESCRFTNIRAFLISFELSVGLFLKFLRILSKLCVFLENPAFSKVCAFMKNLALSQTITLKN